jgi:hypothetical protein
MSLHSDSEGKEVAEVVVHAIFKKKPVHFTELVDIFFMLQMMI